MLKNSILVLSLIFFSLLAIFSFVNFKFSSSQKNIICLKKGYELYKETFMSVDGRIIDYARKNITTSEGQSYMMLRSLIMEDKETFDLAWNWTKENLQRKDKLFSWLWGEDKNGQYKILDENSASDADVDIAFALISAYEQWHDKSYLQEALILITAIWDNETKRVGEYLVIMPGAEQMKEEKIEINPSYFSPYAFKLFEKYDEIHSWDCLVNASYYYIPKIMEKTSTGLPPDWFIVSKEDLILENSSRSDFSYDAIRVFARFYLDYAMTEEPRALPVLQKTDFFVKKWEKSKIIYTNYKANGQLKDKNIFKGGIAVLIPAISTYDKNSALEIYKKEIEPVITTNSFWTNKKDYYGNNLMWFGLYLYSKEIKGCEIEEIQES